MAENEFQWLTYIQKTFFVLHNKLVGVIISLCFPAFRGVFKYAFPVLGKIAIVDFVRRMPKTTSALP